MVGSAVIFENFEIAPILLWQFQNFQKCTWEIYTKSPSQTCDYWYILHLVTPKGSKQILKNGFMGKLVGDISTRDKIFKKI